VADTVHVEGVETDFTGHQTASFVEIGELGANAIADDLELPAQRVIERTGQRSALTGEFEFGVARGARRWQVRFGNGDACSVASSWLFTKSSARSSSAAATSMRICSRRNG
jgi:hypothetical protein